MTAAAQLVGQRSRHRIPAFRLHRPATVDEAVALQAAHPSAAFMAGGVDLVNRMKAGAKVADVIHLGRIAALAEIEASPSAIRVGAALTHRDFARSPLVRDRAPALAAVWLALGNPRIRFAGTLGGNLMADDPGYDARPILSAYGATATIATVAGGSRTLPLADLSPDAGLLVAIEIPVNAGIRLLVDRSLKPAVNLALGLVVEAGFVHTGRISVGCAFARPWTCPLPLQRPLSPADLAAQAPALAERTLAALPAPLDDWQASAAYRRRMTGVLLHRLLLRQAEVAR